MRKKKNHFSFFDMMCFCADNYTYHLKRRVRVKKKRVTHEKRKTLVERKAQTGFFVSIIMCLCFATM